MPVLLKQNSTQDGMIPEVSAEFLNRRREFRVGLSNHLDDILIHLFGLARGTLIQGGPTPHTEVFVARRFLLTPSTHDRPERFAVVLTDIDTVDPSNLAVSSLTEHRDVPGGDLAPALPPVMLLQVRLRDTLTRKITRARFSEVRRRHGLRHPRTLRGLSRNLQQHRVTHRLRRVQSRPQRRAGAGVRMDIQPLPHVRDTRDDDRAALSLLSLHGDALTIVVITDGVHGEVPQLEGPGTEVPRERDESLITIVPALLKHRLDVLTPEQHLSGIGRRIIIRGIPRGNPLDTLGFAVAGRGEFAEDPEGGAIVLVGLGVLVLLVDPRDDALGRSLRLERVGELAVLFSDLPVVDEMEAMPLVAVLGLAKIEFVAHPKEGIGVVAADVFFGFNTFAESFDGVPRVADHARRERRLHIKFLRGYLNPESQPLPGHKSIGSGTKNTQPAATSRGAPA